MRGAGWRSDRGVLDSTLSRIDAPGEIMTAELQTSYDQIPYESHPYDRTHPDHLSAMAKLFGSLLSRRTILVVTVVDAPLCWCVRTKASSARSLMRKPSPLTPLSS